MSKPFVYDSKLNNQRGYWLKKLAGIEERASIGHSGGGRIGDAGEQEYRFTLPEEVVQGLKRVTGESVFLLYTALLSAVQINLYRYSGVSAVISGSPRREEEGEKAGPREPNLVAVVTEISGRLSFRECLLRVREGLLEAYKNQDYPLEALLRDRKQEEGSGLFELVVSMKGLHGEVGKRRISGVLMWEKEGEQIVGQWKYEQGWLSEGMIAEFSRQIVGVLKTGLANHQVQVREMEWMGAAEQRELVERWKGSEVESGGQTVVELIEEQVKRDGEAVAVVAAGEGIRYGELNERANQLGRYLRKQGVGVEVRVGLYMERGVELVIGILGIMKAGGVYVPLDPEYPGERLRYILKDSGARILLKGSVRAEVGEVGETGTVGEGLEGVAGVRQISIAAEKEAIASQSRENLEKEVEGENLVYVIYTSGSTGQPKGVGVTQAGLAERAMGLRREYGLKDRDRLLQFVSPSFDAFGEELFPVLISGGRVVMQREVKSLLPEELLQLVEREQITVLHCLKGFWTELERHIKQEGKQLGRSVRSLITGGETIYRSRAEKWIQTTGTEMWVAYGPTEATITATVYQWKARESPEEGSRNEEEKEDRGVSLGRPVMNTRLYVVDEQWRVVPVGVAGELCIGGAAVARGYLGRAELTAEKFVPEPLQAGARMYRSGDLGRWNEWGKLEFLGRKDGQVKIRGYRVELGEVEAALHGCEGVKEGVVIVGREEGESGSEQLVAYVAGGAGARLEGAELRTELEKRLPKHMVPGIVMVLPELPRTASGKVDQQKLPTPVRGEAAAEQRPRTQVEEILADIWRQVLKLEHVGIDQNFFELGGDSILTIRIAARAKKAGLEFKPQDLFEYQTIRKLAEVVGTASALNIKRESVKGIIPLAPSQKWFLEQNWSFPQHCNQSLLLQAQVPLHSAAIERSVSFLLDRHEALTLRFHRQDEKWEQSYDASRPKSSVYAAVDLTHLSEEFRSTALKNIAQSLQASLDLDKGPLMRVVRFIYGDSLPDRLLIIVHHLAVDVVSWSVLLDDLQTAYEQISCGEPVRLPPTTFSFPEWTLSLQKYVEAGGAGAELPYWTSEKRSLVRPLPQDFILGPNQIRFKGAVSVSLDEAETEILLRQLPKMFNCEVVDVLVASLLLSIRGWTRESYFLLDMEGHGREALVPGDLSSVVGWFTAIFPAFFEMDAALDLPAQLQHVKRQLRAIPDKGIRYGLLRYLDSQSTQEKLKKLPQADINFNYQGVIDSTLRDTSLFVLAPESAGAPHSPSGNRRNMFDIVSRIAGNRLRIDWIFSTNLHRPETILGLSQAFIGWIRRYLSASQTRALQPAEFPLATLTQEELHAIIRKKATTSSA